MTQRVDSSSCRLCHKGKELDRDVPFRLLNLPSSAALDLITGMELGLGVQTDGAQERPKVCKYSVDNSVRRDQPNQHNPAAIMEYHVSSKESEFTKPAMYVFSRSSEIEIQSRHFSTLPSDIDYEVNQADVLLLHSSLAKKKLSPILKTNKMREVEMQKKLDSLCPVQLRMEFPGSEEMVVQFETSAKSPISTLYDIMERYILNPKIKIDQVTLFTAPPKCILDRKSSQLLYDAGLHPAARIKVGISNTPQRMDEIFCSEILKDVGTLPPRTKSGTAGQNEDKTSIRETASYRSTTHGASKLAPTMPKWFSRK